VKIIIVDDEFEILDDMRTTLQAYEEVVVVGTYINPFAALEDIKITQPDCVFLDIEMPGMSGIDLAERLMEINAKIKLVFLTAYKNYAIKTMECYHIDYLLKPIHPRQMDQIIPRLEERLDIASEWKQSKGKELLDYMVCHTDQRIPESELYKKLWPECESKIAKTNLRITMCALRKYLDGEHIDTLKLERSIEGYLLQCKEDTLNFSVS